jgi:hypothetical protein
VLAGCIACACAARRSLNTQGASAAAAAEAAAAAATKKRRRKGATPENQYLVGVAAYVIKLGAVISSFEVRWS